MSALSKKDISKTILTSYRDNEQITESDDDSRTARQSHRVVRWSKLNLSASLFVLKDDAVRIFQEFAQSKAYCSQSRAYALNRLSWRASKKRYLPLTAPCVSDGPINGVLQ